MLTYTVPAEAKQITIGRQGENEARCFVFDITDWIQIFGDEGAAQLLMQRPGETAPYACLVSREEALVSWIVREADTQKKGYGQVELVYTIDDQVVKSRVLKARIEKALMPGYRDDLDPWEPWMEDVLKAAAKIDDFPGTVAEEVAGWLEENIGPTTPAIDKSLSVEGAGADAKVTGEKIADLKSNLETGISTVLDGQIPVLFGLHEGFIGSDGVIHIPSTGGQNERYTDRIAVTPGESLYVDVSFTSAKDMWVAYAAYDQNGDFLRRVILTDTPAQIYSYTLTIPADVSSVSVIFRSWDGADFRVTKHWDIGSLLQDATIDGEALIDGSVSTNKLADSSVTLSKLSGEMKERTRNLFDSPWEQARYDSSGVFIPSTTDKTRTATRPDTPVTGGKTYTVSFGEHAYSGVSTFYIQQFDSSKTRITFTSFVYSFGKKTITLEQNTEYLGFMVYSLGSTPDSFEDLAPEWTQVEEGNEATAYVSPVMLNSSLIDGEGLAEGPMKDSITKEAAATVLSYLPSSTVRSVAHRGDDIEGPQCTAPAYILARRRGISVAENDLALSEDGEFVMWHDTTLARLGNLTDINGYGMYTDGTGYFWVDPSDNAVYTWNGTAYVASSVPLSNLTRCAGASYGVNSDYGATGLNLGILKRIDFGLYKGSQFAGTRILTFEEWVLLCKQLGMEIYVDKKLTYTEELLARAANIVKGCGMASHTSWLGVGGVADIRFLRTILPDARVGVLSHPTAALIETYGPVNTGRGFFFNGDAKNGMTRQAVRLGLEAGFDVEVWFVDVPASYTEEQILETIRTATSYGVTAMSLDHYRVEDAFLPWLGAY